MATLKPPFTPQTAHEKVKAAQTLWNTRNPHLVAPAYTETCTWRNRSTFLRGHAEIIAFLAAKWEREQDYRLRKELFCFSEQGLGNEIAVEFWYEYRDREDGGRWKRCYGIEHWTFDAGGKMEKRVMSANDVVIGVDGDGVGRWFGEEVDDVDEVVLGRGEFGGEK